LVAAHGEVPVDAVGTHIERAVLEPFDRDIARETRILDLGEWLDPVDPLGLLAPEAVGVFDRQLVKLQIRPVVAPCPPSPFVAYRDDLVVGHGPTSLKLRRRIGRE
jgi:hypothetical protein